MSSIARQVPAAAGPDVRRRGLTRDERDDRDGGVGELLHLPVSTVYYLPRRGEIPVRRLGRTWRFIRPLIEEALGV